MRLLTLTGPGGTGKTRLALQVAAELLDDFADGVWFVELAPMHDPALVASAIAAALGVKESGGTAACREPQALPARQAAAAGAGQLRAGAGRRARSSPSCSQAAPALKVLVTSRAALHLRGEHEVAGAAAGAARLLSDLPTARALTQYAAVRAVHRTRAGGQARLRGDQRERAAVAEICVRLDGLPLAIELAAARSKLLAASGAARTAATAGCKLLTGGARDLPTRQQTLRGTIDWSYNLLDAAEQRLFTRLAVFVGGWTVEAAEAVC